MSLNPVTLLGGLLGVPWWLANGLAFLVFLYVWGTWYHGFFKQLGIPQLDHALPVLGNFLYFIKHGFKADDTLVRKYGRIFGYFETRRPVIVVCDAEAVRQITVKDFDKFPNRRVEGFPIAKEIKDSVSLLKGEEWKAMRNVITPTFSGSKMKKMSGLVIQCSKDFCNNLASHTGKEDIEMKRFCGCYTMDVVGRTLFGVEVNSEQDPDNPFVRNARKAFDNFSFGNPLFLVIFFFPFLVPVLEYFNVGTINRDILRFFKEKVDVLLDMRKTMPSKNFVDFLQLMMNAHIQESEHFEEKKGQSIAEQTINDVQKDTGKKRELSRNEILSNALIFFLVGYETTASALSWVSHLLAVHPDVQERLHEEVVRVMEQHDGEATYEAIGKMTYLDQVVSETLRLYPSAQRSDRVTAENVSVAGYTIPKGQIVNIGIMGMQRDPEYWPDPEKFDPERFSPGNKDSIVPYSWCPFGTGPRSCIGMRLALLEVKTATAYLVKNFKLSPSHLTVEKPELKSMGFSSPVNGIHLKIDKR